MSDKTNFGQSLMHLIKCNLGTGLLAMPASFAHTGLINAIIGLPLLALMATYCVHLLVRSAKHLEKKLGWTNFEYAELAKGSFKAGPLWMRGYSSLMCKLVDATLIISQMGICCVYLVFVVNNISTILTTYNLEVDEKKIFILILPVALLLSYIRTLRKLAIASACANILQVVGISMILNYLVRNLGNLEHVQLFNSIDKVALGFGSAMFAFEGISVVLPVYTRMKDPKQMGGYFGAINLSYILLLCLYFSMGIFGYLKYGHHAQGSITLNLPAEPLYDIVRAMFTLSLFLTYPLQFYVPNEIIWNWAKSSLIESDDRTSSTKEVRYEYYCRTILVIITFILAMSIPMLNLLMDLVGSISGTMLSIVLPPLIHLAAFWEDTSGSTRFTMVAVDLFVVIIGVIAGTSGSVFSVIAIMEKFSAGPNSQVLLTNVTQLVNDTLINPTVIGIHP